jgi:hypothetical protein
MGDYSMDSIGIRLFFYSARAVNHNHIHHMPCVTEPGICDETRISRDNGSADVIDVVGA